MSSGCFYLLKFNKREQMSDALVKFDGEPGIKSFNAVDGHFGLVVTTEDNKLSDFFTGLNGFEAMAKCEVEAVGSEKARPEENAYSYLFIETDEKSRPTIFEELDKMDEVYFCARTTGDYSIVAVVGGADFSSIGRFVEDNIQSMSGLLRMKQDRLIYLDHI